MFVKVKNVWPFCFCFYNVSETLSTAQGKLNSRWLPGWQYGRGREGGWRMVSTYEVPGDTHVPNNFPPGQSNLTVNLRKPRHMVFSCLVRSHLGFIEAAPTSRKTCQTGQLLVFLSLSATLHPVQPRERPWRERSEGRQETGPPIKTCGSLHLKGRPQLPTAPQTSAFTSEDAEAQPNLSGGFRTSWKEALLERTSAGGRHGACDMSGGFLWAPGKQWSLTDPVRGLWKLCTEFSCKEK